MKHVIMFSGGVGSWYAAHLTRAEFPAEEIVLLFADTITEDPDLYRFVQETAPLLGELVWLREGRNIWEVFNDTRFLGNSRVDPCSRILKREECKKWVDANCERGDVIYVGIDWTEEHRLPAMKRHWAPLKVRAPLCESRNLSTPSKSDAFLVLAELGIEPPALYQYGFAHNNCGGFCVKSGRTQFAQLLQYFPERYRFHEEQEERIRVKLGNVSIMRETRFGKTRNLTMKQWRERLEKGERPPRFEIGGCGCG